jgi:hypothetical protein
MNPVERARVRSLCQLIACDVHPLNNLRVLQYLEARRTKCDPLQLLFRPTLTHGDLIFMTSRAGSAITWASYNYPTEISASDATGSEEVQFSYGPDRQRWEQIYSGPSGTEQTYYVGKKLEVVFNGTTNYRHYIYAGSEPVAVYSRTSAGVNTMSYFLEDHQGGVSAITSNAGAADVDESFSSFGTRRNPTTWSGAPTT